MEQKTIYYISEAAKKVQVESHVLRYWEEELKLPIMRNEMGHRCYTEQDIRQLQEIKQLKEQGLQLKAIRTVLFRVPGQSGGRTEEILMRKVNQAVDAGAEPVRPEMATERKGEMAGNQGMAESFMESRTGTEAELEEQKKDAEEGTGKHMEGGEERKMKEQETEMDITHPQRFVVALSKEKEEPAETEADYTDMDKSRKAARLQYLLQHMITEAVRSANREMCTDVKESILKELDYQFRMQEERDEERWKKEEEHYRRIDEMIRERHRPKERLGRGKKKSPIADDSIKP